MDTIDEKEFERFLFLKRGRSPGGIKTALSHWRAINNWLILHNKPLTVNTFEDFFYLKQKEGCCLGTLHAYKTVIHLIELFTGTPLIPNIKLPEVNRKIPAILSTDEVKRLLSVDLPYHQYGNKQCGGLEYTYKVLTELLYFSGCRIEEVLTLTAKQLLGDNLIHFDRTKFNIERIIFLFPPCYEKLAELSVGKSRDELIFTNMKGNKIHGVDFRKNLKKRAKAAGVTTPIHPHTLRHTIATHLSEANVDIRVVQKLLGHKSLDSTVYYEQFNLTRMQDGIYTLPLAQPYLSKAERINRVKRELDKLALQNDSRFSCRIEETTRYGKKGLVLEMFEK